MKVPELTGALSLRWRRALGGRRGASKARPSRARAVYRSAHGGGRGADAVAIGSSELAQAALSKVESFDLRQKSAGSRKLWWIGGVTPDAFPAPLEAHASMHKRPAIVDLSQMGSSRRRYRGPGGRSRQLISTKHRTRALSKLVPQQHLENVTEEV